MFPGPHMGGPRGFKKGHSKKEFSGGRGLQTHIGIVPDSSLPAHLDFGPSSPRAGAVSFATRRSCPVLAGDERATRRQHPWAWSPFLPCKFGNSNTSGSASGPINAAIHAQILKLRPRRSAMLPARKIEMIKTTRAMASMMHAPMLPCAEYSMELV